MVTRINKACDGCRVRKVKCNGEKPCSQCSHLDLSCHFSPPTGKRKPGVRNRLVEQLRENGAVRARSDEGGNQNRQLEPRPESYDPGRVVTQPPYAASQASTSPPAVSINSLMNPPISPTPTSPPMSSQEAYDPAFFHSLIPSYSSLVYPVNPIIHPDEIRSAIGTMHTCLEDAALVYGFAAVTINLTQTSWTLNGDVAAQMTDLMQRSLAAHRMADLGAQGVLRPGMVLGELPVTVKRIMTCIFLEISMMAFRLFQRSFAILREAIALVQTLRVFEYDPEDPACALPNHEISRRQRLYWECFIHERFVNIMSGCPSLLPPLGKGLPLRDPSIPPYVDHGFRLLISLFRVMDESFLGHWNSLQDKHREVGEPMTAEWIESKQAQLDAHETESAAEEETLRNVSGAGLTELQHADLFITRLWLRTLIWQLALSQGLLRSAPAQTAHQGLSLHFPAQRLSSQLRSLVSKLESVASIGTHGSGILQKLFEITTTVADVLALPAGGQAGTEEWRSRMEDFVFLVAFLFRFERISVEERRCMREKVDMLQSLYPAIDFGSLAVGSA